MTPFVHDWVLAHAAAHPDAPALATRTVRLTYAELADRARRLAGALQRDGLSPGDHVLVALPNEAATVVVGLAVQLAGGAPIEIGRNPAPAVVARAIATFRPRLAVIADRHAEGWPALDAADRPQITWTVAHAAARLPATDAAPLRTVAEDGSVPNSAGSDFRAPPAKALSATSTAVVLYTSGSTGTPHAVAQSHGNVSANSRAIVEYLGLTSADRAMLTLPLSYCYGRSVLQTHLLVGGSVYLDSRSAFPAVILDALAEEGCTGFAGVPLTFELMRRQANPAARRFPRLRYVTQAGGGMAVDTIRWTRDSFRPADLFVMYGQTEATARLSYLPPERLDDKVGSIGIPIPGVTLRVVDDAARPLDDGLVGNLVARGPNVTAGYVGEPEATAEILHDGWLWTGDLASRDADGYFTLHGRSKEILKVNGHRVGLVEVEQAIARHPDVADAGVIGVPDDLAGQIPVALVVPREGSHLREDELREFARGHLAPQAVPARYVFVTSLERSAAGKLRRTALHAILAAVDGEADDPPTTAPSVRG